MMRTFSIIFLFFFFASCGKSGGGGSSSSSLPSSQDETTDIADSEDSSGIKNPPPAPELAATFDIKAKLSNFTRSQENKVLDAFDLIKKVVSTDEFKKRVLNFTYNGKRSFANNNGLTNSQIYKKILEGAEKITPSKNNAMDLVLITYFENNSVIGHTNPSIKTIYMNTKYLNMFEANEVAMNLFHEWLHKIGFGHDYESTTKRPYSVPYAIGYIMRSLAQKYE